MNLEEMLSAEKFESLAQKALEIYLKRLQTKPEIILFYYDNRNPFLPHPQKDASVAKGKNVVNIKNFATAQDYSNFVFGNFRAGDFLRQAYKRSADTYTKFVEPELKLIAEEEMDAEKFESLSKKILDAYVENLAAKPELILIYFDKKNPYSRHALTDRHKLHGKFVINIKNFSAPGDYNSFLYKQLKPEERAELLKRAYKMDEGEYVKFI